MATIIVAGIGKMELVDPGELKLTHPIEMGGWSFEVYLSVDTENMPDSHDDYDESSRVALVELIEHLSDLGPVLEEVVLAEFRKASLDTADGMSQSGSVTESDLSKISKFTKRRASVTAEAASMPWGMERSVYIFVPVAWDEEHGLTFDIRSGLVTSVNDQPWPEYSKTLDARESES